MPKNTTTTPVLAAQLRTEFGKGASRRSRRDGLVPAVLYGHGTDPVHLALPGHDTFLALKGNPNALVQLTFDGTEELALTRDVQRDPVKRVIEHVDLLLVKRGEKVVVEVPVVIEGESYPGTIHALELQTVTIRAEALSLPEHIVANIDGLNDGDYVRASDLQIPAGAELEVEADEVIVLITEPYIEPAADVEAAAEAATEATPAAEA
ncbi:50S ribosomal protein L25/general stress protein Ctc [Pseudactinotalea sp. HY158]|uniref:50S ribosomal protein L25/general stress protein Ctc n=1 Tax=Pseudactinotalea sp. HY158 TaxID=2654547 RepID=UPI001E6306C1|nr:50S ribosomal protein L25/general stress protein Ctc [Pseudactinotalea sp. HY158]